jgi:heme-binding NEAT domain protein
MRSVDVEDYGDSPALVVVYTREDLLGTLVWTQVSFFSEDSTITLIHIATLANPTNGLADFDTMVRSFRFGT